MKRLLIIAIFSFQLIVYAQSVNIQFKTDKSAYLIGDYIKITLVIKSNKNVEVVFPVIRDSIKQLEFIRQGKLLKDDNDDIVRLSQSLIFSKYEPDTIEISPLTIFYKVKSTNEIKSIRTKPISFIVKSYPVDTNKEIIDIKKPISVQYDWAFIILIILGLTILLTIAYFIWKKYKSQKSEAITEYKVKLPNYQIALDLLYKLEEEKLWQKGKIKEYHTAITEIIRKYFEDDFNFNALEMTSNEIIQYLKNDSRGKAVVELVSEFFANADMVKFAKFQPMASVNEMMMKQAIEIINRTKIKESISEENKNV